MTGDNPSIISDSAREHGVELTERIAAAVVSADPNDPQALAALHGEIQSLASWLRGSACDEPHDSNPLLGLSSRAEQLLERIILRDEADAVAAMARVTESIVQMQSLLQGTGGGGGAVVAAIAELTSAPAAPGARPEVAHDHASDLRAAQTLSSDDLALVQDFVTEARGHIESAEASILALDENPQNSEAINAIFRAFHTIKGVAGFLNLKQIGALAHSAENLLDLARQGTLSLSGDAVDVVLCAIDLMKVLVENVAKAAQGDMVIPPDAGLTSLLDRLAACVAGREPGPARETSRAAQSERESASGSGEPKSTSGEPKPTGGPGAGSSGETSVRVSTERLDSLINTVGELVIAQAMVTQDAKALLAGNHRLARDLGHLGKITRELQELSMSMRMVPIHGVFQKMARLVRDLAKKTGKDIELSLVGGETELDRNLVEAITDPLVHMVRNAADHGIEMPDQRGQAGKPRAGTIELKAYHHSGSIVIEITDDGRGLNKAKILKKAVAAGIVPEGAELPESEIFKLIFHAGLSTAEKVTDVSGRGVGMDVVKRNVEALRGRIDITSVEGKGATFAIRLPLTLAVIDGLVVKVGASRFILPILSVEQSLRPKPEQLSSVQDQGEMCMVRQTILPLYRLHQLLDVVPTTEDPTKALVVIVQDENRRCCLLVDELLGQQQVVIKSLDEGVGRVRGVSGGAILGDGNVSLILDVPSLMDVASGK
jgi:two-component system chemotaxis sensor kinase CheA